MSIAAYNRGSRLVSREADARMPLATARADRQAHKDEVARLREQIATLERDLRRARRCLASERAGREALRVRLAAEERAWAFGVGILCRLAFPGDGKLTKMPELDVENAVNPWRQQLRDAMVALQNIDYKLREEDTHDHRDHR